MLFLTTPAFAVNYGNDANCMGYWPMEQDTGNNETDLSGEGEDLTDNNNVDRSADKKFGTYSRGDFADDTSYLSHADGGSSDINGVDQELSLVAFVKDENADALFGGIISKYNTTGDLRQYILYVNNTDVLICILSSNGTATAVCTGATDPGQVWRHVAAVYNDIDIRIYLDGSLDNNGANNPKAYTGGIADKSAEFQIGRREGSTTIDFDGLIDDVAIFDRELTSVEVSDINTNGVAGAVAANPQVIIIS